MGRPRKHDRHLPARVYLRRGAYYLVLPDGQWVPLGRNLTEALAAYALHFQDAPQARTMGDVLDRYEREVIPLKSAKTGVDQRRQVGMLRAVFGAMHPDSLTAQDIYKYIDKRGKVPIAARHEIGLLSHVYTKAIRWGAATVNPCKGIERPPPAKRTRYVSDAEFAAVRDLSTPIMQCAMDLALLTGLRQGDLLGLRRTDCGTEGITVKTSKTGKSLLIQWSAALKEAVDRACAMPPAQPAVFLLRTRTGEKYSSAGFQTNWKRTMEKAVALHSFEAYTFHDLRAKSASDTGSLDDARDRLGHASATTTQSVYRRAAQRVKPLR